MLVKGATEGQCYTWGNFFAGEEYDELDTPDNKVHGANMGPTWILSAPDGPHVGPMNLAIRDPFAS